VVLALNRKSYTGCRVAEARGQQVGGQAERGEKFLKISQYGDLGQLALLYLPPGTSFLMLS